MATTSTTLVELRDAQATTAVVPELGGALAWFRWHRDGHTLEWLRPADRQALTEPDAGGMACFPLVPYSNRVRGGHFAFAGRTVQLPVSSADPNFEHGHGWRRPWTLEHRETARAVLRFRHQPDAWPWCYEAEQDIALVDGGLVIRLTLRNLSDGPMPAGFGLHPYFPTSPKARIETEVEAMWETDTEILPTRRVAIGNGRQTIEVAKHDLDNVFIGWSRRARIVWPERSAALDLEAEAPLDLLVLYTPPGEPYFCAEPVSNITDAFNLAAKGEADTGLFVLAPGETRTAVTRFTPRLANAV